MPDQEHGAEKKSATKESKNFLTRLKWPLIILAAGFGLLHFFAPLGMGVAGLLYKLKLGMWAHQAAVATPGIVQKIGEDIKDIPGAIAAGWPGVKPQLPKGIN